MPDGNEASKNGFKQRLEIIKAIEDELLRKSSALISNGQPVYVVDFFVLGGIKRGLAVAAGFRSMLESRNFTCAAALLRMQIDTAARIFALSYVSDPEDLGKKMTAGERFDKQKDRNGDRLRDAHIVKRLAVRFPWVQNVYEQTSGFVHLSGRHFFSSVSGLDDKEKIFSLQISATDPERPESDYFEILEAFAEATRVVGLVTLGHLEMRRMTLGQAQGGNLNP